MLNALVGYRLCLSLTQDFLRIALGGCLVGIVVGSLAVYWLGRVFNDKLVEITVTLGNTWSGQRSLVLQSQLLVTHSAVGEHQVAHTPSV